MGKSKEHTLLYTMELSVGKPFEKAKFIKKREFWRNGGRGGDGGMAPPEAGWASNEGKPKN